MMPLDATFPASRLAYMLEDANVFSVVTTAAYRHVVDELDLSLPVTYIDSAQLAAAPSAFDATKHPMATRLNEAYIVYTSGSTGKPKGVPVLHQGAVNMMTFRSSEMGFVQGARVMQFMAMGFDGFQWDMWKTLSNGATLVLRSTLNLDAIKTVDAMLCTPTALSLLGCPSQYPNLKYLSIGGESCPTSLKNLWAPRVVLINLYGPSECAVVTHYGRIASDKPITIGRTLENVNCYILEDNQRPVPLGVVGEIYLGGICVSPSYIHQPEQTAQRFLDDSIAASGRMFRTGDLGRLLPSGEFEILGRQDNQVKLKGYRIELDEVAEAMMMHPDVVSAAAIVKDKTHLVGYFAPADVSVDALQETVSSHLPVYMVPAVWIGLAALPQNVNGKIDKKALEALDVVVEVEGLQTEVEYQLASVWSQVLDVPLSDIGRSTSFFELGGDSISAVRVASSCREQGLALTVGQLVKASTLSRAAASVRVLRAVDEESLASIKISSSVLHAPEMHAWKGHVIFPTTPLQRYMLDQTKQFRQAHSLQAVLKLPDDMSAIRLMQAFLSVVECNDLLRTRFVEVGASFYAVVLPDHDRVQVAMNERVSTLADYLARDQSIGFDLARHHPIRFAVVVDASTQARHAVVTVHHCAYDGWSVNTLLSDIVESVQSTDAAVVPARPSFLSVVKYIQSMEPSNRAFWTTYLAGLPSTLTFAWPTPSVALQLDQRPAVSFGQVGRIANHVGVAVSTLLQFAWAKTLHGYDTTRQRSSVVFALTLANRSIPVKDVDRIIGPLINDVPCRVSLEDTATTVELLHTMQSEYGAMLPHSFVDLADISTWRGHADTCLCDTMFLFQHFPAAYDVALRFDLVPQDYLTQQSYKYSVVLIAQPTPDGALDVECVFNPAKLSSAQASRVVDDYHCTLGHLLDELDNAM